MAPERTVIAHRPSQPVTTGAPYTIMMKSEQSTRTKWRSYPPIRRLEPAQKKDESQPSPSIQPSSRRDYVAWSKRETHALVQWLDLDDNFNAMKRNTARMLPMLSKYLQENVPGCFKTPKQCDHKIRNLKKCYKKVIAKLAESGKTYNNADTRLREELIDQFPYFEQFERFMVDDHIVRHFPSALLKLAADGGTPKSNCSPPRKEASAKEENPACDNDFSASIIRKEKQGYQNSPIAMIPASVSSQSAVSPATTLTSNHSQASPMLTPKSISTIPANTSTSEFPDMSRFRSIRPKDGPTQCPVTHHKSSLVDSNDSNNTNMFNSHTNNIDEQSFNNNRSSESQMQDFLTSSHFPTNNNQQQQNQQQSQPHKQQQHHHHQLQRCLEEQPDYKKQKLSSSVPSSSVPLPVNNAANSFLNMFPQSLVMGNKASFFSGLPETISKCPVKMDELDIGPKCPVGLDSSVGLFGSHGSNFGALASLSQIAKPIAAASTKSNITKNSEITGSINSGNGPVEENNPHGTLLNILKMMSKKPNSVDNVNLSSGSSQPQLSTTNSADMEDNEQNNSSVPSSSSPQETAQILAEHIKTSLAKKEAVNRQKLYLNHLQQQIQRHTMRAEMLYNNGQVSRASKVMDKIDELELELHEVLSRPLNQF